MVRPGAAVGPRADRRWESTCCWFPTVMACRCWRPAATTWAWGERSRTKCRSNSTRPTRRCQRAIAGARLFSPDRRWEQPIWWRSNGPAPATRRPRSPGKRASWPGADRAIRARGAGGRFQSLPQHARRADRPWVAKTEQLFAWIERAAGSRSRRSALATAATKSAWDRSPGKTLVDAVGTPAGGPDRLPRGVRSFAVGRGERLGGLWHGAGHGRVCAARRPRRPAGRPASQGELIPRLSTGRRRRRSDRRADRDGRRTGAGRLSGGAGAAAQSAGFEGLICRRGAARCRGGHFRPIGKGAKIQRVAMNSNELFQPAVRDRAL